MIRESGDTQVFYKGRLLTKVQRDNLKYQCRQRQLNVAKFPASHHIENITSFSLLWILTRKQLLHRNIPFDVLLKDFDYDLLFLLQTHSSSQE